MITNQTIDSSDRYIYSGNRMNGQVQRTRTIRHDSRILVTIRIHISGKEGLKCLLDRALEFFENDFYKCPDGFTEILFNVTYSICEDSVEIIRQYLEQTYGYDT